MLARRRRFCHLVDRALQLGRVLLRRIQLDSEIIELGIRCVILPRQIAEQREQVTLNVGELMILVCSHFPTKALEHPK